MKYVLSLSLWMKSIALFSAIYEKSLLKKSHNILGMDGVDKEKVQKVVYEMSKGSKYFENEERKEALMSQKIENMRERRKKLSAADISHYQKVCFYIFI